MVVTTPSFWAAKWHCQMALFSWLNTPRCPMEITPFQALFSQWEWQIRWSLDCIWSYLAAIMALYSAQLILPSPSLSAILIASVISLSVYSSPRSFMNALSSEWVSKPSPSVVDFIYNLDISNSSSFTFWSSKFSLSSWCNWKGILNGSWNCS